MDRLDGIEFRFQQSGEVMTKVLMDTDRRSGDMCMWIGQLINKQNDIRKAVEGLARHMDAMQNGTNPGGDSSDSNPTGEQNPSDASIAMQLEIDDKRKVARLREQSTQHTQQIDGLTPLTESELILQRVKSSRGVTAFQT